MNLEKSKQLLALSRKEPNARKRIRLLAVSLFFEGENRTNIAKRLNTARGSVNKWVSNYLNNGVTGLNNKPIKGRPAKLTLQQLNTLSDYVKQSASSSEGGRLMGEDIAQYIYDQFNIRYHTDHIYKLLKKRGFSWITSRSKHPKQSKESQEAFKKFQVETILHTPGHLPLDRIDVWFQDEARFGQQNQTTRLWAETGSRPRATKQQQFEYGYLFGAVCPSNGKTEALISPIVNKDVMTQHMELISKATEVGRHAVVIVDGAGWHTIDTVKPFNNVTLIKLPPYSPELNPIEQVWSWIRQHCLSNRVFSGYEEIVEQVSQAWNKFISVPDTVKSICSRDWIKLT
ncbi:IS630 family transposase [Pseudoalteromonas sp. SG44-1]|uniref:IS630 family transposase n=5 Tax=unclassified Pseudoalteromonas TaxID=194690 RepID=UPI001600ADFF|nr:IS630 family transposase [Pseudoalteromonas sp. SG44-1]MBB1420189.1 IS630 family transposase [Pseudoalteromonas sp. SG44-1]